MKGGKSTTLFVGKKREMRECIRKKGGGGGLSLNCYSRGESGKRRRGKVSPGLGFGRETNLPSRKKK